MAGAQLDTVPAFRGWLGEPLSMPRWAELLQLGRHVAVTTIGLGTNQEWASISTTWMGLDLSDGLGGGLELFETMVFGGTPATDHLRARYPTLMDAVTGHRILVEELTGLRDTLARLPRRQCQPLDRLLRGVI